VDGLWLGHEEVERLVPGKLGALRRLAAKGPLTHHSCRACGGPMKSLDVPGHQHEGDLFWGHESPRPTGSCVADACPRCGAVGVDAGNLERAGGRAAFEETLARVMLGAS
jgi:hypothetical protein